MERSSSTTPARSSIEDIISMVIDVRLPDVWCRRFMLRCRVFYHHYNSRERRKRQMARKILIVRIEIDKKSGGAVLRESKPCGLCLARLQQLGIRTVYHSTQDGYIVQRKLDDLLTEEIHWSRGYRRLQEGTYMNSCCSNHNTQQGHRKKKTPRHRI